MIGCDVCTQEAVFDSVSLAIPLIVSVLLFNTKYYFSFNSILPVTIL